MKFDETFPEKPKKANKASVCSKWPLPWIFPNPATRHDFIWDLSFLKALDRNIVVHYSEWDGQEGQKGWVMTHIYPQPPNHRPTNFPSPPNRRISWDIKDTKKENDWTDRKSLLFGNINEKSYLSNYSKLQLLHCKFFRNFLRVKFDAELKFHPSGNLFAVFAV